MEKSSSLYFLVHFRSFVRTAGIILASDFDFVYHQSVAFLVPDGIDWALGYPGLPVEADAEGEGRRRGIGGGGDCISVICNPDGRYFSDRVIN